MVKMLESMAVKAVDNAESEPEVDDNLEPEPEFYEKPESGPEIIAELVSARRDFPHRLWKLKSSLLRYL